MWVDICTCMTDNSEHKHTELSQSFKKGSASQIMFLLANPSFSTCILVCKGRHCITEMVHRKYLNGRNWNPQYGDCSSPKAAFRLHNIFVNCDSHCVRLRYFDSKILDVTWTRNMSDYTLLPDKSSLAVFNNVCDVIKKVELATDFQKQECKQTVVVLVKGFSMSKTVGFPFDTAYAMAPPHPSIFTNFQ